MKERRSTITFPDGRARSMIELFSLLLSEETTNQRIQQLFWIHPQTWEGFSVSRCVSSARHVVHSICGNLALSLQNKINIALSKLEIESEVSPISLNVIINNYSIPSLVRGPSVVRGFERRNFSSHPKKIASK
jgi:hypothetical protein